MLRDVVTVIKLNLGTPFFHFEASLVRDGCFYAALLLANGWGTHEDVEFCLQAMKEMRWVFSKSEERMEAVRMVWHSRLQQQSQGNLQSGVLEDVPLGLTAVGDPSYARRHAGKSLTIPPLTIPSGLSSRSSSAPNTALTQDGSWPSSISGGSSRTHSQPASLYGTSPITSRTSPYLGSSQLGSALAGPSQPKSSMQGPLGLMLNASVGTSGLALERPEDSAYFHPYGYSGLGGEGPPHVALLPQPGASTASIVLAPYHQMSYQDSGITFGATHMDATGEHHILSPVDDDESGLVDSSKFF